MVKYDQKEKQKKERKKGNKKIIKNVIITNIYECFIINQVQDIYLLEYRIFYLIATKIIYVKGFPLSNSLYSNFAFFLKFVLQLRTVKNEKFIWLW